MAKQDRILSTELRSRVMSAEDADAVQRLLDEDPFHQAHLITQRTLRPWKPILGPFAT